MDAQRPRGASLRRADLATSRDYIGNLFSFLAGSAETGGGFGLIEILARRGLEPPLHVHEREDEAFYVLDGEVTFRAGEELLHASPGSFILLPRGVAHGFAFESESVRMLALLAPAGLEQYFVEASEPATSFSLPPLPNGTPDVAAVVAHLARYGVSVVGPPLRELLQAGAGR